MRFFNNHQIMEQLTRIFIKAYRIESRTYRLYDESRKWFRYNDREIFTKRDGISLRGNGIGGIRLFLAEHFFLKPGRESWHSAANRDAGMEMFRRTANSARGYILLSTKKNEKSNWICAGRDYARLCLAITEMGFAMQPFSQILQEYPENDILRREFDSLIDAGEYRHIQMIIRLGRSEYDFNSPRREVGKFIPALQA